MDARKEENSLSIFEKITSNYLEITSAMNSKLLNKKDKTIKINIYKQILCL